MMVCHDAISTPLVYVKLCLYPLGWVQGHGPPEDTCKVNCINLVQNVEDIS